MMNYNEFKIAAVEEMKKAGDDVQVVKAAKVNGSKEGIAFRQGGDVAKTIYIDDMYDKFNELGNFEETISYFMELLDGSELGDEVKDEIMSNIKAKKFFPCLVNATRSKELLETALSRPLAGDVSVIYRVSAETGSEEASTVITKGLAEAYGLTEEEVYDSAILNEGHQIMSFGEFFAKMGMPPLPADHPQMYIVTRKSSINGSGMVLCEKVLAELEEKLGESFYILPSSVHEVICLAPGCADSLELAKIVVDVNRTVLAENDFLSDGVFLYEDGKIKAA